MLNCYLHIKKNFHLRNVPISPQKLHDCSSVPFREIFQFWSEIGLFGTIFKTEAKSLGTNKPVLAAGVSALHLFYLAFVQFLSQFSQWPAFSSISREQLRKDLIDCRICRSLRGLFLLSADNFETHLLK